MITLTLLGTGGATPYKARTTPMVTAEAGRHKLLIDCGSGATLRLAQAGIPPASLDYLLFTHFHADHCVDFPVFVLTSYLGGREQPLRVYGPQGTRHFVDIMFNELFAYIPKLIASITDKPFKMEVEELTPGQVVQLGDAAVKNALAKHNVPALCFRIETSQEAVTISGDTEFSDEVINLAKGSQVLVHECPFPVHMGAIPGHTTAEEVGRVAAEAGVRNLVLTHLFEEVVGHEREMKEAIATHFTGVVLMGQDLMRISVKGTIVNTTNGSST